MSRPAVTPTGRGLVVTGGTSGIGLAIAIRLARTHRPVHILSRQAEGARADADHAFRTHGLDAPVLHVADVTDKARLQGIANALQDDGVDVRTVVAAAGVSVRALALEVDDAHVRAMVDTNLYGVIATFQAFAPLVLAGPDGRFIAISSLNGIHGQRLRAVYSGTKAGVSGLVRALAAEWSKDGATVNAIAPGIIRTPMTAAYMDANPERTAAALAHSLVGRLGTPEDIAFTAEYLASPECGFVTGQTIVVDGGITAGSDWW